MQKKYKLVAMGGTFDIIHKGHLALLQKAFDVGDTVIIGVTSDKLATEYGKNITNNYGTRVSNLKKLLESRFRYGKYVIKQLLEDFGPALFTADVEALVVSKATEHKGDTLNELRSQKGLNTVDIVTIDLILASDGRSISSTRIRNAEIDSEGNVIK
ncbi:MAG: phosphopantetheine adenylyltransferase [Nitrososphaerales archaeon]